MIKVVYAKNGTGKSLRCESEHNNDIVLFSSKKVINSEYKLVLGKMNDITESNTGDFDTGLSKKVLIKNSDLSIYSHDLERANKHLRCINTTIVTFENKKHISQVKFKKIGERTTFKLSDEKIPLSSGELNYLMTIMYLEAAVNLGSKWLVVYDDPCELSSYGTILNFVNYMNEFNEKYIKNQFIFYTHNFLLYKTFFRIKKTMRKCQIWVDERFYDMDSKDISLNNPFLARNGIDEMIRLNKKFNLGQDVSKIKYDKKNFSFRGTDNWKNNYSDYIDRKFHTIHVIREGVKDGYDNLATCIKKEPAIIKNEYWLSRLLLILNVTVHHSDEFIGTTEIQSQIESWTIHELYIAFTEALNFRKKKLKELKKFIREEWDLDN